MAASTADQPAAKQHKFGDEALPCEVNVDLETGWWDKDAFQTKHEVLQLRLPARKLKVAKDILGDLMLRYKFVPCVIDSAAAPEVPTKGDYVIEAPSKGPRTKADRPTGPDRWLCLDSSAGVDTSLAGLPAGMAEALRDPAKGSVTDVRVGSYTTTWRHMRHSEAVNAILPEGMEALHSFEQVGHLAHMNMHKEHLPYKALLAQMVLDYNPGTVTTVVNKTATIDTVFRTFGMEVVKGTPNLNVELVENGIHFKFPFDKVYWNSRLESEHRRVIRWLAGLSADEAASVKTRFIANERRALVDAVRAQTEQEKQEGQLSAGALAASHKARMATASAQSISVPKAVLQPVAKESLVPLPAHTAQRPVVIADMFCGIGPFALPVALRQVTVHANDLNPESIAALKEAALRNKVDPMCCIPYNMDARAFIRGLLKGALPDGSPLPGASSPGPVRFDHALMNLPADAIVFCDVFSKAFPASQWRAATAAEMCRVHRLGDSLGASVPSATAAQRKALGDIEAVTAVAAAAGASAGSGGAAEGSLSEAEAAKWPLPRVHCYCFSKTASEEEAVVDVKARLESTLGGALSEETSALRIRVVRDVAPGKLMMLASFTLPASIALTEDAGEAVQPSVAKKPRLS